MERRDDATTIGPAGYDALSLTRMYVLGAACAAKPYSLKVWVSAIEKLLLSSDSIWMSIFQLPSPLSP